MRADEPIGVLGLASWVPEGRMSAAELAGLTGGAWTPEAVIDKLGIEAKTRAGPDDGAQEMGARAAMRCLRRAGVDPREVDAILCIGDEHREYPMTTSGIYIQERIGARRAWAVDVMQKCSSFAAGIRLARGILRAERNTRTVLLAGGYRNGDWIDYTNPRVSFMYNLAPGGGAMLLRRGFTRNRILGVSLCSDGALSRLVVGLPREGSREGTLDVIDQEAMRRLLAERSVPNFLRVIHEALAEGDLTEADIGYLAILHMKRSAHAEILRSLGLAENRSTYLSRYGHIGQFDQILSLELALEDGRLRDGDVAVGVGAGIGYSWGAVAIAWGEERETRAGRRVA
jgi:3-oxoacyl-[acyl-carrier-protein] synthase-3